MVSSFPVCVSASRDVARDVPPDAYRIVVRPAGGQNPLAATEESEEFRVLGMHVLLLLPRLQPRSPPNPLF